MLDEFVFNNVVLKADFSDLSIMESYEKAMEMLAQKAKTDYQKASEMIRHECMCINEAFDLIFGEGSSDKLFENKMNREVSYKALYALHDHVAKSQVLANENIRKLASKYQRRK